MGFGPGPITWRYLSLLLRPVQDQIKQFGGGIVAGEVAPRSDRTPEFGVQRLDGIGGKDDPADLVGEGEERDDLAPGAPPAVADGRIALAPKPRLERRQRLFGCVGVGGVATSVARDGQIVAVLPID